MSNRPPFLLRGGHAPPPPAHPRRPPPADPRRGPALLHPQRLPGHHDGRHLRRGRPVRRLGVLPLHRQGRDHRRHRRRRDRHDPPHRPPRPPPRPAPPPPPAA